MNVLELGTAKQESRVKRLKEATHGAHERLDKRIMAADPFSSRERYGLFLMVQYRFHRDIDALYGDTRLSALLPDLASRRRLGLIEQDLADLGISVSVDDTAAFGAEVDVAAALGWLYVAEGSNLGAAFLLREAAKLDLDARFGARHLAPHPEGRGLHWRRFTAAFDTMALSPEEEARTIDGAKDAFARVHAWVERFPPVPSNEVLAAASPNSEASAE